MVNRRNIERRGNVISLSGDRVMSSFEDDAQTFSNIAQLPADYRQVSKMRRTLVGNKIVDHSDVVGASPFGAAPTTSSFST